RGWRAGLRCGERERARPIRVGNRHRALRVRRSSDAQDVSTRIQVRMGTAGSIPSAFDSRGCAASRRRDRPRSRAGGILNERRCRADWRLPLQLVFVLEGSMPTSYPNLSNISILDLASVGEGETIADSFAGSVRLAQLAEQAGYKRVWYAEHHSIESIASSATSVLIAHIGAQTSTIRLGAGGIMLPNHAPMLIAEQFGTLETLYPGRIDLGL